MNHIIVSGNTVDGFTFYGPYFSAEDATSDAEAFDLHDWHIAPIAILAEVAK